MEAVYEVEVTTGFMTHAGTFDNIFITLIGTQGESERTRLDSYGRDFKTGMKVKYIVTTKFTLAHLLLIRLEKDQFMFLPENDWFCSMISVRTPEKDVIFFPCYRWMADREVVELREAKAMKINEEKYSRLKQHRENELKLNKELYQWSEYEKGLPQCAGFQETPSLPSVVRFSFTKAMDSAFNSSTALGEIKMKKLANKSIPWADIDEMKSAFWSTRTTISEYVHQHWMDDDFFGYQLLNGPHPMMLRRCTELPSNFAVTDDMLQPILGGETSLTLEMKENILSNVCTQTVFSTIDFHSSLIPTMEVNGASVSCFITNIFLSDQNGNIFLCDYRRLVDLPTQVINGVQQHIAAPLCLLYKNQVGKLLPIAIQLKQQVSEENPVFLPSDCELDWLLAKLYVRNADCLEHQASFYYLRSHLLAEVFTVALLRNLPAVHPIYKLLIPHTRYTFQINALIRDRLLGPEGLVTQNTSIGGEGMCDLMKKAFTELTYKSLCLPDDISDRGLESIPNFFYREDGLKLWDFINNFVRSVVQLYYQSDGDVQQDSELQDWIREIFIQGFLGQISTGIPQCFITVDELIKFITMVIFTVSAQHSALRAGQFDYSSWFPNSPCSLKKPPPTTKGSSDRNTLLDTLPDVNTSVNMVSVFWLLSKTSPDLVPLGQYPEDYFCQAVVQKMIKNHQAELSFMSESIKDRNLRLKVPYTYLCPDQINNSVSI